MSTRLLETTDATRRRGINSSGVEDFPKLRQHCATLRRSDALSETTDHVGRVLDGGKAVVIVKPGRTSPRRKPSGSSPSPRNKLSQARLRNALRFSLSEVLAAFFSERQGEEGVYRGLSLIGRCRDAGLSPYPFDFLGAMRACNSAGLYSTALRLFNQLTAAASDEPSEPMEYLGNDPEHPEGSSDYPQVFGVDSSAIAAEYDSDFGSGSGSGSGSEVAGLPPSSQPSAHGSQHQRHEQHREDEDGMGSGQKGTTRAGKARGQSASVRVAYEGSSSEKGCEDDEERENQGATSETGGVEEGGACMRFENLNDIPDGELLPAAAATIALESCFLDGRRDQAMDIVWKLIRRRHPLTEPCRNRAIVALTSGGHPDMALNMAREMEKDRHFADRATLEFVERFEKWAFDAAEAYNLAEQEGDDDEWDEEEEGEDQEEEDEDEDESDGDTADGFSSDDVASSSRMSSSTSSPHAANHGRGSGRPSELFLRFLPLLSETLRSKLRPEEAEQKTSQMDDPIEEEQDGVGVVPGAGRRHS